MIILVALSACAKSGIRTVGEAKSPRQDGLSAAGDSSAIPEQRIYFPFDSDFIMPEATGAIDINVEWLKKQDESYVILEGHCDDVGSNEFNVQLGDRRARAVKAYMMERGIPAERIIMVVSYGSARPLNSGHEIADLRQNRRVEFVIR